jgi:hypothetical protein
MAMDSPWDTAKSGGLPHSEISGSTVARTSPELFAACHVLHRLSVPRHSPDALLSNSPTPSPKRALARAPRTDDREPRTDRTPATGLQSCLPNPCDLLSRNQGISLRAAGAWHPGVFAYPCPGPAKTERLDLASRSRLASRCQRSDDRAQMTDQTVHRVPLRREPAVPTTADPTSEDRLAPIRPLSSVFCPLNLVGLGRLERPTSRLSGVRSNQLSYRPKIRDQRTDDR